MSTEKGDSVSTDDDEEIVFKKLSAGDRGNYYADENSDESFGGEYEDSDSLRDREERQIYEYDEDEDVSFDYDEGSSSMDDLEHLDFEEEDEIMQVIVDEDGKANVAIVDEFEEVNDDEDVIIPLEDQSLKTEAEIGSEIFESSPYQPKEEEDPETPSLKTSLRNITQQFVNATLVLGQPINKTKSHSQTSEEQSLIQNSREISVSTPSLHVDREIKRITDTYVDVTKNLGRWRSESVLSSASDDEMSRKTVTYNKSLQKENCSSLSRSSAFTIKEVDSVAVPQDRRRSVGKVLGELGKSMISITKRIGRSFSTNSLTESNRSSLPLSVKQKSFSEQSLVAKVGEDDLEKCESVKSISQNTIDPSAKSRGNSLIKAKSLSNIVEPEPSKTPELRRGLQKITEDVILITKCLQSPSIKRDITSVSDSQKSGKESLVNSINKTHSDGEKLNESQCSKESNKDPGSPIKRDIHPFIMKILKKEESIEISKILIEAHQNDMYREKLQEESMTLKNSIKSITNDILTVTQFLGTNLNEVIHETEEEAHKDLLSDESIDFEDLKTEVPEIPETPVTPETPDMKLEIKKFTDDIVKVTKLLCNVRKKEILKVSPDEVYMRGGIDAMSCATMDSSPTK